MMSKKKQTHRKNKKRMNDVKAKGQTINMTTDKNETIVCKVGGGRGALRPFSHRPFPNRACWFPSTRLSRVTDLSQRNK